MKNTYIVLIKASDHSNAREVCDVIQGMKIKIKNTSGLLNPSIKENYIVNQCMEHIEAKLIENDIPVMKIMVDHGEQILDMFIYSIDSFVEMCNDEDICITDYFMASITVSGINEK